MKRRLNSKNSSKCLKNSFSFISICLLLLPVNAPGKKDFAAIPYTLTMNKCLFCLFIIFFTVITSLSAQHAPDYGLRFFSHEVNKDLRTSIDLNPDIVPVNGFSLSFSMHLMENREKYGYIFRVIVNDKGSIDLISNSHSTSGHSLTLIEGNKPTSIFFDLAKSRDFKKGTWVNVIARFQPQLRTVSININGKELKDTLSYADFKNTRVFFGANEYGNFSTSDVPPIEIRDLKIHDSKMKLIRHWEFKQHMGSKVYDLVQKQPLQIKNPIWLIDQHTHWKKRTAFYTKTRPQISFVPGSGTIVAATGDSLYTYSLESNMPVKARYAGGTIFPVLNNQMIFHPYYRELWQYDLRKNHIAKYNFADNIWDNEDRKSKEPQFWHHNKFISPLDSSLYIFGGYGNFTYKNILQRFDESKSKWDTVNTSGHIWPRYLSAAGPGMKPSEVLIFGGYGNASGKQELSPEKLYDLYSLDLATNTFKKRWEMDGKDQNFVVANSLVPNKDDSSFYALCFPIHKYASYLYLRKISVNSPTSMVTGDSIPYFFHDTKSYGDLFYSPLTKELIAVACYPAGDSLTAINVYTIAYPAIPQQAAIQFPAGSPAPGKFKWFYILLLLGIPAIIYLMVKKKYRVKLLVKEQDIVQEQINHREGAPVIEKPFRDYIVPEMDRRYPSLYLLGGLQVIDKEGTNITPSFTPALKQLLMLLALYTSKTGKGISSVQLKNILWPDKTEDSARNNRGVSIKKIRTLLGALGNASVVNESNNWALTLNENIFCDYFFVQHVLSGVNELSDGEIEQFLNIASKGSLLPDMEYDWLDSFKSDYASKMIDTLVLLTENTAIKKDPAKLITISDLVLLQDPLNETALKIKCKELFRLGKYTVAKSVYSSFTSEYALVLGTQFHVSFEEVIK